MPTSKKTSGYKGFDKDLKCRDTQYKVGETTKLEKGKKLVCCPNDPSKEGGLHFCENPMDVFNYYSPADSRFCEVEGIGDAIKHGDDTKVAVSKLHISAEISLKGLLTAGVKFILDRVKWEESKESNTGDQSAATNTGDRSAATNTGDRSAATNTGYRSAATNTGYQSAATNTGYQSAATNTGNQSAATNTGNQSAATNTGYRSAATVEGKESVAISIGYEGKAKGKIGCFLVLAEWKQDKDYGWHRENVASIKVDGTLIKEEIFYILKEGIFTETN